MGLNFLFYLRVLPGKHNDTFDHRLFDVKESDYLNHLLFFEDPNLNNNKITSLEEPVNYDDAVNKGYVGRKVVNVDLSDYLKRDGSLAMTGNFNMNDQKITYLVTQDDINISDYHNYIKYSNMAIKKEYARENILKKDGVHYNLRRRIIKNCEIYYDGLFNDNDLVSKAFVDAEIGKLPKNVLLLDGSIPMRGNLQMGRKFIRNLETPPQGSF